MMFGSVSGYSNSAYTWLNTRNIQPSMPSAASAPIQGETASLPVQPVPAAREVLSNDAKFSIESMLNQHASDPAGMAARMRIQYPGVQNEQELTLEEPKSAQEVFEEAECQTCAERKYQDGSDDPGVSFKTATHISPEAATAAVRGHEMEHVVRNQAKAARENREVVSQSVIIHTDICPECGRVYTSGGTTRTVTRGNTDNSAQQNAPQRTPFSAVA